MKRAASLCVLLVAASACEDRIEVGPVGPAPGRVAVLDPGDPRGQTGWWPSAVFDHHDVPHVSYCDAYHGDLRYATRAGGSWHLEAAVSRGRVGKYTALAVDSEDRPAIAFYDQDHETLRYAWRRDDGEWRTERIAWGHEVGMGAELRFDARDVPHLFYYVPSGEIVHAYRPREGEWVKKIIAPAGGGYSVRISPVLRPDGFWLSFVNSRLTDTVLMLARQAGPDLQVEKIAERHAPGWRSQLLLDGGEPTLLYSQSVDQALRLATLRRGRWHAATLLHQVGNFAATRAANGDTVVAYQDVDFGPGGDRGIKLLRHTLDGWRRYEVDSRGPAGLYLGLATDSQGRALVVYYSGALHGLKVYEERPPGGAAPAPAPTAKGPADSKPAE